MSTLKADTIVASDGSSPVTLTKQSAAKVWAYHESQSLVDSFNVSSGTDIAAGVFNVTFTNALSTDDWSGHATTADEIAYVSSTDRATTTLRSVNKNSSFTLVDASNGSITIHGDLA